jgi:ribosomal protein S18 acetylase RimI-like enzyme
MYEIRPLHRSDLEDVLEIARNTWDGYDYLPYSFDGWMNDPTSHTACIEQDGHVVALANLRVIENGRTGWMEALRVHPQYRGKGLASALTDHVVKVGQDLGVQRLRYTTATVNTESLHLGARIGMHRMFTLAVYWHENPADTSWRHSTGPEIVALAPEEIAPLIDESDLFPHKVVIYDWKAVDASLEGLHSIAGFSELWTQVRNHKLESFSLGFSHETHSGLEWSFSIYARSDDGFLDHLSHHLRLAAKAKCVGLFMVFPLQYLEVLRKLDWIERHEDDDIGLTFLERVL